IAWLLGLGPLRHATGRSLLGETAAAARQRAAVHRTLAASRTGGPTSGIAFFLTAGPGTLVPPPPPPPPAGKPGAPPPPRAFRPRRAGPPAEARAAAGSAARRVDLCDRLRRAPLGDAHPLVQRVERAGVVRRAARVPLRARRARAARRRTARLARSRGRRRCP